jgi:putative transcriptional regulator
MMADQGKTVGFASGLMEGLREAVAWKRRELPLEVVDVDPIPAARIKVGRPTQASARVVDPRKLRARRKP